MQAYLEHANMTVPDIDAAISFLKIIEPSFRVREDSIAPRGYRWVHIGSDDFYIALQAPHDDAKAEDFKNTYVNYGINHLAFVVSDANATASRLTAAGYRRGIDAGEEPHRIRFYFFDSAGFEWEIVEYTSDEPEKRNSYSG